MEFNRKGSKERPHVQRMNGRETKDMIYKLEYVTQRYLRWCKLRKQGKRRIRDSKTKREIRVKGKGLDYVYM